ncbi:MAG: hypothetical protein V3T04_03200 [Dehalococcoidia bacterium]
MSELVLPKGGKVTRCSIVEYTAAVRGRPRRQAGPEPRPYELMNQGEGMRQWWRETKLTPLDE